MSLAVAEHGHDRTHTVVLLHGGGGGGWMWAPQLEALSAYHVLVPDLPEHGASRTAGPFSIASAASAIAALVAARAHGGRAVVIGASLGAQIALQLVATAPERVSRAMLTGALVRPVFGASLAPWMARSYWPFKDAPWLVRANMKSLGIPMEFFEPFAAETRATTLEAFLRITGENTAFRAPEALANCDVPMLVLVGSREPGVMLKSARDLAALVPTARAYRVEGASHNWSMETPALFNETARAWLDDAPLPASLRAIEGPPRA